MEAVARKGRTWHLRSKRDKSADKYEEHVLFKFKRQAKTASRQCKKKSKKQLHKEGEEYLLAWFPVPEVVCSPGNPRWRLGLR